MSTLFVEEGHDNDYDLNEHIRISSGQKGKQHEQTHQRRVFGSKNSPPIEENNKEINQSNSNNSSTQRPQRHNLNRSSSSSHKSSNILADLFNYLMCSGRFRSELMAEQNTAFQKTMKQIVLSFACLVGYICCVLIVRSFIYTTSTTTIGADGEIIEPIKEDITGNVRHYIMMLFLLALTPISNQILGSHKSPRWGGIQPFYGGTRFIFLQALAWCFYGIALAAVFYLLLFGIASSSRFLIMVGWTAGLSQVLVVVSIVYYQADGARKRYFPAHITFGLESTLDAIDSTGDSNNVTNIGTTAGDDTGEKLFPPKQIPKLTTLQQQLHLQDEQEQLEQEELKQQYRQYKQQHEEQLQELATLPITNRQIGLPSGSCFDVLDDPVVLHGRGYYDGDSSGSDDLIRPKGIIGDAVDGIDVLLPAPTVGVTSHSIQPSRQSSPKLGPLKSPTFISTSSFHTLPSADLKYQQSLADKELSKLQIDVPKFVFKPLLSEPAPHSTLTKNKIIQRFIDIFFVGLFYSTPFIGGAYIFFPDLTSLCWGLISPATLIVLTAQVLYYLSFIGDAHLSGDNSKNYIRHSTNPLWSSVFRYFNVHVIAYTPDDMEFARSQSVNGVQHIRDLYLPDSLVQCLVSGIRMEVSAENSIITEGVKSSDDHCLCSESPSKTTTEVPTSLVKEDDTTAPIRTEDLTLTTITAATAQPSPQPPSTPSKSPSPFSPVNMNSDVLSSPIITLPANYKPVKKPEVRNDQNEIVINLDDFLSHTSLGLKLPYLYYMIGSQRFKHLQNLAIDYPDYKPTFTDLTFSHPDLILSNKKVILNPLPPISLIKLMQTQTHIFIPTISTSFAFCQSPHGIYPMSSFFAHKTQQFVSLFGNRLHTWVGKHSDELKYRTRDVPDVYGNPHPTFNRFECYTFDKKTTSLQLAMIKRGYEDKYINTRDLNSNDDSNREDKPTLTEFQQMVLNPSHLSDTHLGFFQDSFLPRVLTRQKVIYPHHGSKIAVPTDVDVLGASVLSFTPGLREAFLWTGGADVSRSSFTLRCAINRSVYFIPSGQKDMQYSNAADYNYVFYTRHLGFIKLALRAGIPLVPIISFGENQLLSTFQWPAFQRAIYKYTNVFLPILPHGPCFSPIPWSQPITIAIGEPIFLPCIDQEDIPDEIVSYYHNLFLTHLARLFFEARGSVPHAANSSLTFI